MQDRPDLLRLQLLLLLQLAGASRPTAAVAEPSAPEKITTLSTRRVHHLTAWEAKVGARPAPCRGVLPR
jgi:hypothetical protein